MKIISTLLLTLLCSVTLSAHAQWQWTDKSGRKVYSDQPPGSEIAESAIVKRPGGPKPLPAPSSSGQPSASSDAPVAKPVATTPAPKNTGKDAELEKKKSQADAQAASKTKAEEEKNAIVKADNCDRAKRNLASLQSGARIAQTNAQGEREFMSDETKAAEVQRTQGLVDNNCK
jgi:hypothetical protein